MCARTASGFFCQVAGHHHVAGHRVAGHRLEWTAARLHDRLRLRVGKTHEQVLAEEAGEHVAVHECGQVAEHRLERDRRVAGHELREGGLRLLGRLRHLHRLACHGTNLALVAAARVVFEIGSKRTFASAIDWPGWCRAGKDQELALAGADRLRTSLRGRREGRGCAVRVEVAGNSKTSITSAVMPPPTSARPALMSKLELQPMSKAEVERMCSLVEATWKVFDGVVKKAPASLRKGPRGGGRDRDKIVEHVLGAEVGYGSSFALKLKQPEVGDTRGDQSSARGAGSRLFAPEPTASRGARAAVPRRYMARRIAWHAMDHAWEIEDRSEGLAAEGQAMVVRADRVVAGAGLDHELE